MAQFIRLAASLEEGRNLALPESVAARYARHDAAARAPDDSFNVRPTNEELQSPGGRDELPRRRARSRGAGAHTSAPWASGAS